MTDKCRYCGRVITKPGPLARHEAVCSYRQKFELSEELEEVSHEDEPPRFKNAHPRVYLGSGVQVWKRG